MNIRPIGDKIFAEETPILASSNLIVVKHGVPLCARVSEVGPRVQRVKPGDLVYYSKYSGKAVRVENKDYTVLTENEVLAIEHD